MSTTDQSARAGTAHLVPVADTGAPHTGHCRTAAASRVRDAEANGYTDSDLLSAIYSDTYSNCRTWMERSQLVTSNRYVRIDLPRGP